VDSANKHGILLEAVQVLTELNLNINKAYVSSDGRWFMDGMYYVTFMFLYVNTVTIVLVLVLKNSFAAAVFHVTDENGKKLTDEGVIGYIEKVICLNLFQTRASFLCF